MRFCDFFCEYELRVLEINSSISFRELELYKKIGIIGTIVSMGICVILVFFRSTYYGYLCLSGILFMLITIAISNKKSNKKSDLEKYYKVYSKERMRALLSLLSDYKIDYCDESKLKLLIEYTEYDENRNLIFKGIKKPISGILSCAFSPAIAVWITKYMEEYSVIDNELLLFRIFLLGVFAGIIVYSIKVVCESLVKSNASKYDDLKSDLKQILIFGNAIKSIILE